MTKKDKDISFGPDFMSDDIPMFENDAEEKEYKTNLEAEKEALSEKLSEEKTKKSENKTDKAFLQMLSMMASQAYIFLGAMENPATGTATPNLEQAQFQIDSLSSLYTKCDGNLSDEEDKMFKQLLNELRLIYVEATRQPPPPAPNTPNPPKA